MSTKQIGMNGYAIFTYNTISHNTTTGYTPFEFVYGWTLSYFILFNPLKSSYTYDDYAILYKNYAKDYEPQTELLRKT